MDGRDLDCLLQLLESDKIDLDGVQEIIEMKKREELIHNHPYAISKGKDGFWRTYLPDKEKGRRMIKRKTEKAVKDVIIAYWQMETKNPIIKELFYEWMNQKREYGYICDGTYERYECDFKRFFEDDSEFAHKRIRDIAQADIVSFMRKAIAKYSLTAKSYGNLRTLVLGTFKYAKENGYITWSISQTLDDMELPRKAFRKVIKEDEEEVFTDDEMSKLMTYLTSNLDILNLSIILMFCTGVRVGELAALKWEDVCGNAIKIRRTEIRRKNEDGKYIYEVRDYPKTEAGIRTVFVPKEFTGILLRLRLLSGGQEYMLWNNGARVKTTQIRKRLYLVCKKSGVRKKSPHKLRKTYVSILLDNGVDNRLVQDVAGHAQILTSERNYHRNRKSNDLKEQILSNLPEFKRAEPMF